MFERKKQAGKIYFLPIDQIRPSPFQARREFSEQELAAMSWWRGSGGSVPAGWQR